VSELKKATKSTDVEPTRATAHLPGLDIEIVHRRSPGGEAEQISINMQAVPSFEAFGRLVALAGGSAHIRIALRRRAAVAKSPHRNRRPPRCETASTRLDLLFAHDLFRKPVATFRNHALAAHPGGDRHRQNPRAFGAANLAGLGRHALRRHLATDRRCIFNCERRVLIFANNRMRLSNG
jgi:hypothetical protein